MNRLFKALAITLFCFNLCIGHSYAQTEDGHNAKKTQVVIIGTIHSAHYENPNYSPEKLKEIILSLKPDVILNELPLSLVNPNGRPIHRDRKKHPEGWAADTVAQQLGIKQIPFDRPDRQENFRKTRYFEREKRANKAANKWYKEVKEKNPNSVDLKIALLWWKDINPALGYLSANNSSEVINSKVYDSLVRMKQSVWFDVLPEILANYNGYEVLIKDYHFARDQWHERNNIMAANILKAAKEYPGKRLIVITGGYHRYILRDLLKDDPHVELKEYWEIVGVDGKSQEPNLQFGKVSAEEKFNPAECFDKVWQIINKEFWDPNFNGVDWEDAGKRYKPKALAAKDHESFAVIVNQMLAELKTSHTYYYTKWEPEYYIIQVVFGKQDSHRNGIGVVTKNIDGRHYVIAVLKSSSAEKAGIVLGDWLVEVDGQSFHPIRSFENKAGQELEIIIQRGTKEATRQKLKVIPVDRKEEDWLGNDSHASLKTIEYKGHSFAYVRLWWLRGIRMRDVLEYSLHKANEAKGIIIDLRDGVGGDMGYEFIAPLMQYGLGETTVESTGRQRKFKSIAGCNKPVVVLINGGSRSGKETLAYLFKKTGRGILVGERTAGYVTGGRKKNVSSDSFLYYGVFKMIIDGKRLEGVGVEPDIKVPFDIRFAAGRDIQLERAKDEMVKLIEALQ